MNCHSYYFVVPLITCRCILSASERLLGTRTPDIVRVPRGLNVADQRAYWNGSRPVGWKR